MAEWTTVEVVQEADGERRHVWQNAATTKWSARVIGRGGKRDGWLLRERDGFASMAEAQAWCVETNGTEDRS